VLLTVWFLALAVWVLTHLRELLPGVYLAMVLLMVFEMWMAQLWAKRATNWERAYYRDTGELQQQLQQLQRPPLPQS
jgi:hypothetical protein